MKRLSIFSRLMIGYLVISILVLTVSGYAIFKIRQFNRATQRILTIDTRILEYEKELIDSVLSQSRFERKYILTKDGVLYEQFQTGAEDFKKKLDELTRLVDTTQMKETLYRVTGAFEAYQVLVKEEVQLLQANRNYRKTLYDQEKEKKVDAILEGLETLETLSQHDITQSMKQLGKAGATARRMVIGMALAAVVLVLVTSLFITKAITRPLKVLVNKTKEISNGVFQCTPNISSPPEVLELSKAFNRMCERLGALDRMKSDFFSSMSHELRTPLASIKEGISLLHEGVGGSISEKQKRLLAILTQETNRLIDLVNSLLDLSKMEAGMMTYHFENGRIPPLIERAMNEVSPLVESKKIQMDRTGVEALPPIRMDSERILQALRNLIGNAVKFTPEGGRITVSGRCNGHEVVVAIQDTGPGISPEKMTTIFEKYRQAEAAGAFRTKGTGLGLSIAKHIVSSHGGRIWVESKPGEGSTFFFALPG